MQNYILTLFKQ